MQRTGVLRLVAFGVVAARDDDYSLIVRRRPDLMKVDALLKIVWLSHLVAEAAVGFDPMNADACRKIVSDEDIFVVSVDAVVDGPPPQLDHFTMLSEFSIGTDPKGR